MKNKTFKAVAKYIFIYIKCKKFGFFFLHSQYTNILYCMFLFYYTSFYITFVRETVKLIKANPDEYLISRSYDFSSFCHFFFVLLMSDLKENLVSEEDQVFD